MCTLEPGEGGADAQHCQRPQQSGPLPHLELGCRRASGWGGGGAAKAADLGTETRRYHRAMRGVPMSHLALTTAACSHTTPHPSPKNESKNSPARLPAHMRGQPPPTAAPAPGAAWGAAAAPPAPRPAGTAPGAARWAACPGRAAAAPPATRCVRACTQRGWRQAGGRAGGVGRGGKGRGRGERRTQPRGGGRGQRRAHVRVCLSSCARPPTTHLPSCSLATAQTELAMSCPLQASMVSCPARCQVASHWRGGVTCSVAAALQQAPSGRQPKLALQAATSSIL